MKYDTSNSLRLFLSALIGLFIFLVPIIDLNAQNYGMRDDGGVNLPTVTYWYTGSTVDSVVVGSAFDGQGFGIVSSFIFKGAAIKTWKATGGDVTGAQFNYKVWGSGDTEPEDYIVKDVNWSSDDGGGNQTWAGFGDQIDVASGLSGGVYNVKILFSISGTGTPGITENGPFVATFEIPSVSSAAEILSFSVPEEVVSANINNIDATIELGLLEGADVTALVPMIVVSDGATINPDSGISQNFTNDVIYTVTAEDNTTFKTWTVSVAYYTPNYGINDNDGVNLPEITYLYTGLTNDVIEQGADFDGQNLGVITSYSINGVSINTWKVDDGDVTGAQLNYKVWSDGASEPAEYTTRSINWTSNEGGGDQIWSDFGDDIDITTGLAEGDYNIKVLFSISGNGIPGLTEDGPYSQTFAIGSSNNMAQIDNQYISCGVNDAQQTFSASVFDGIDFGEVTPTSGLHLYGGGVQTFESGNYDFVGAKLYYRVYQINDIAGSFESVELPFVEDLPTVGEEVWETLIQDIDLSAGLTNGDYYFEVYFDAEYSVAGGGETFAVVQNNDGNNYKALFSYNDGVGMDEVESDILQVYPNPAMDLLNMEWKGKSNFEVMSIYTSNGKLIYQRALGNGNHLDVNISNWTRGLYFLTLTGNGLMESERIIIE
jgi:hypothetical protein